MKKSNFELEKDLTKLYRKCTKMVSKINNDSTRYELVSGTTTWRLKKTFTDPDLHFNDLTIEMFSGSFNYEDLDYLYKYLKKHKKYDLKTVLYNAWTIVVLINLILCIVNSCTVNLKELHTVSFTINILMIINLFICEFVATKTKTVFWLEQFEYVSHYLNTVDTVEQEKKKNKKKDKE